MSKVETQGIVGFTDKPIENTDDDTLGVKKYADGLATFIKTCETPMTIAIQGDWGCGKTSMMKMVQKKLDEGKQDKDKSIWFNTWQYSKFNLDDELAFSLLKNLASNIGEKSLKEKVNTIGNAVMCGGGKIGKIFTTSLRVFASFKIGSDCTDEIFKGIEGLISGNNSDIASQLCDLKHEFQKAIDGKCGNDNNNRIVIFIDDLDRLEPEKAVDLLEVLKLFLDCDKCVYVLAIDYNVVVRGVKKKYGEGFTQGKNFFDKIIQMPFKMPVLHYNIDNYIEDLSRGLGVLTLEKTDVKQKIVKLIKASNNCNPRSIKRLFNTYKLELDINDSKNSKDKMDDNKKIILFACKCFELFFENMYKKLSEIMPSVENGEELTDENYSNFKNSLGIDNTTLVIPKDTFKEVLFEKLCSNMKLDDTNYINDFEAFFESFCEMICNDDSLDKDRLEILYEIVATKDGVLYEYIKTVKQQELNDGYLSLRGKFAVDRGKDVTVKYKNKEYFIKTDDKYAGKLIGLKKLYEDNKDSFKDRCKLKAKYIVSENTIYLKVL